MFVAKKKVKKLKLKTHRGAAKRFKITSTGKVMRMHSGKRHLLGTKKANRMPEENETGSSGRRGQRSQDVAVRLRSKKQASCKKRNPVFLFAAPGRAQPATVGLPASGPVQIRNGTGLSLAKFSQTRNFRRASKHAVETLSISHCAPVPLRGDCHNASEFAAPPHRRKHHGSSKTRN